MIRPTTDRKYFRQIANFIPKIKVVDNKLVKKTNSEVDKKPIVSETRRLNAPTI